MKNRRGAVTTILAIGALILLGVTAIFSSLNLNKKQTTSSRAAESCIKQSCGSLSTNSNATYYSKWDDASGATKYYTINCAPANEALMGVGIYCKSQNGTGGGAQAVIPPASNGGSVYCEFLSLGECRQEGCSGGTCTKDGCASGTVQCKKTNTPPAANPPPAVVTTPAVNQNPPNWGVNKGDGCGSGQSGQGGNQNYQFGSCYQGARCVQCQHGGRWLAYNCFETDSSCAAGSADPVFCAYPSELKTCFNGTHKCCEGGMCIKEGNTGTPTIPLSECESSGAACSALTEYCGSSNGTCNPGDSLSSSSQICNSAIAAKCCVKPTAVPSPIPPSITCPNSTSGLGNVVLSDSNCYTCSYPGQTNPSLVQSGACPATSKDLLAPHDPAVPDVSAVNTQASAFTCPIDYSSPSGNKEIAGDCYFCSPGSEAILLNKGTCPVANTNPGCTQVNKPCTGVSDTNCCGLNICQATPDDNYCSTPPEPPSKKEACQEGFARCITRSTNGASLEVCRGGIFTSEKMCPGGCSVLMDGSISCAQFLANKTISQNVCSGKNENDCCGIGICAKKGWFTSELQCNACSGSLECSYVNSKGQCGDPNIKLLATEDKNKPVIRENRCYAYFDPSGTGGRWINVQQSICDGSGKKIDAGEIVTAAVSSEDQYNLRQEAFKAYQNNPNVGTGDKIFAGAMAAGDSLGYGWGWVSKGFNQLIGNVTNSKAGNTTAEQTSSFGNYYQANMAANAATLETTGKERTVDLWQATQTGLAGGLEYTNMLSFGLLNTVTGNSVEKAKEALLTNAYGDNKTELAAAQGAMAAGLDVTNTVALLVPVGKGIQGGGAALKNAGTNLAGKSSNVVVKAAANTLGGTGNILSTTGKVFQAASPETWAAGFIKNAPISTAVQATVAKTSAQVAQTAAAKTVNAAASAANTFLVGNPITKPVVNVVVVTSKVTTKVAETAFNLMVPRSALTYTEQEVFDLLARDLKLGLVDSKTALARLNNTYHIKFNNVAEADAFINKFSAGNIVDEATMKGLREAVVTAHPDVQTALADVHTQTNSSQTDLAAAQTQIAEKTAEIAKTPKKNLLVFNNPKYTEAQALLEKAKQAEAKALEDLASLEKRALEIRTQQFIVPPATFVDDPVGWIAAKLKGNKKTEPLAQKPATEVPVAKAPVEPVAPAKTAAKPVAEAPAVKAPATVADDAAVGAGKGGQPAAQAKAPVEPVAPAKTAAAPVKTAKPVEPVAPVKTAAKPVAVDPVKPAVQTNPVVLNPQPPVPVAKPKGFFARIQEGWESAFPKKPVKTTEPVAKPVEPVVKAQTQLQGKTTTYKVGQSNLASSDSYISRNHAEFIVDSRGNLAVHDISSTNGTWLWQQDRWVQVGVGGATPLKSGQVLLFGNSRFQVLTTQGGSVYLVNLTDLTSTFVKGPQGFSGWINDSLFGGANSTLEQARANIKRAAGEQVQAIKPKIRPSTSTNSTNLAKKAATEEIKSLTPRPVSDFYDKATGKWRVSEPYQPKYIRNDLIIDLADGFKRNTLQKDTIYNYAITDTGKIFAAPKFGKDVVAEQGVKHFQIAYEVLENRRLGSGIVRSGEIRVGSDGVIKVNLSSGTFSDYGEGIWGKRWAQNPANLDQLAVIIQGLFGITDKSKIVFLK